MGYSFGLKKFSEKFHPHKMDYTYKFLGGMEKIPIQYPTLTIILIKTFTDLDPVWKKRILFYHDGFYRILEFQIRGYQVRLFLSTKLPAITVVQKFIEGSAELFDISQLQNVNYSEIQAVSEETFNSLKTAPNIHDLIANGDLLDLIYDALVEQFGTQPQPGTSRQQFGNLIEDILVSKKWAIPESVKIYAQEHGLSY